MKSERQRNREVITIVAIALVLAAVLVAAWVNFDRTYFGSSGGWGNPSLSGTILLAPGGRISMKSIPGWVVWIWGEFVDYALQPIKDCISQGTCNQAGSGVGGGGVSGVPPDCANGDFCTQSGPPMGGLMGPAHKSLWNWFTFSEHGK